MLRLMPMMTACVLAAVTLSGCIIAPAPRPYYRPPPPVAYYRPPPPRVYYHPPPPPGVYVGVHIN